MQDRVPSFPPPVFLIMAATLAFLQVDGQLPLEGQDSAAADKLLRYATSMDIGIVIAEITVTCGILERMMIALCMGAVFAAGPT